MNKYKIDKYKEFLRIAKQLSFAGINYKKLKIITDGGVNYKILNIDQYRKVYEKSKHDSYRLQKNNKKDLKKIELIDDYIKKSLPRRSENAHFGGRQVIFSRKNKRLVISLMVLALVALGIIGILTYQNYQLRNRLEWQKADLSVVQTETIQPPPQPNIISPTATIDQAVDWKTYTNEKYGFKVKYDPQSTPTEQVGNETTGRSTPLLSIKFGTNPLKFPHGYILTVNKQKSLDDYRLELIGHDTEKIDSKKEITINGNTWSKLNYQMFITTDYVPVTTAILNRFGYSYAIVAPTLDVDLILSTFKFTDSAVVDNPVTKKFSYNNFSLNYPNS